MSNTAAVDDKAAPYAALATAEIWFGGILVAAILVVHVLRLLGIEYELQGAVALLPLLLTWAGLLLIVAGAAIRRFPQHPLLCNVPLLLWLIVFFMAFV